MQQNKIKQSLMNATEYTKIKLILDNCKVTFGEDILKAVIMSELYLKERPTKKNKVSL